MWIAWSVDKQILPQHKLQILARQPRPTLLRVVYVLSILADSITLEAISQPLMASTLSRIVLASVPERHCVRRQLGTKTLEFVI